MIWPMLFPTQTCVRCHRPVDEDTLVEIVYDDDGKPLGLRHTYCTAQPRPLR